MTYTLFIAIFTAGCMAAIGLPDVVSYLLGERQ
jgi:hypothetical protein